MHEQIRTRERATDRIWAGIDAETRRFLEDRLGRQYARQRLGIEKDHEAQVFGQGLNSFTLRT
jgi:uncharacterized protein